MKKTLLAMSLGVGIAFAAGFVMTRTGNAAPDESDNVRKQCSAFVQAWNKHDAKGMAAIFATDGDSINPMGMHAKGRADVEKAITAEHGDKGPMRESKLEVKDEPIRFITADVAVSDADVVLTDTYGPDGKKGAPLRVRVTNIWKKVDGTWQVFASRPCIQMAPPAAK